MPSILNPFVCCVCGVYGLFDSVMEFYEDGWGLDEKMRHLCPKHLEGEEKMPFHADAFRPSELLLPYGEFCNIVESKRETLDLSSRLWLAAWNRYDFATSPKNDEERSWLRYGHRLGWIDREKPENDCLAAMRKLADLSWADIDADETMLFAQRIINEALGLPKD